MNFSGNQVVLIQTGLHTVHWLKHTSNSHQTMTSNSHDSTTSDAKGTAVLCSALAFRDACLEACGGNDASQLVLLHLLHFFAIKFVVCVARGQDCVSFINEHLSERRLLRLKRGWPHESRLQQACGRRGQCRPQPRERDRRVYLKVTTRANQIDSVRAMNR